MGAHALRSDEGQAGDHGEAELRQEGHPQDTSTDDMLAAAAPAVAGENEATGGCGEPLACGNPVSKIPPDVRWIVYRLLAFGFVHMFKPSEAFLTPYLTDVKGFPADPDVNNRIYPVFTYSYFAFIIPAALLAEAVSYKATIVLEGVAQLATRVLLLWGSSLLLMQLMQAAFGLANAANLTYTAYLYAVVPIEHFQRVTGLVSAAQLSSSVLAGLLGQLLYSHGGVPLVTLFYISLVSISLAVLVSCALPSKTAARRCKRTPAAAAASGAADRATTEAADGEPGVPPHLAPPAGGTPPSDVARMLTAVWWRALWAQFRATYARPGVVRWSCWWALSLVSLSNVENYASSLWYAIDEGAVINGYLFALGQLVGAATGFLPALLSARWRLDYGEAMMVACAFLTSLVLYVQATSERLWIVGLAFVLFEGLAYFALALTAARVATLVSAEQRYVLVFGVNAFFAVGLQVTMQLVQGNQGLDMRIGARFWVYTGFMLLFACALVVSTLVPERRQREYAPRPCC